MLLSKSSCDFNCCHRVWSFAGQGEEGQTLWSSLKTWRMTERQNDKWWCFCCDCFAPRRSRMQKKKMKRNPSPRKQRMMTRCRDTSGTVWMIGWGRYISAQNTFSGVQTLFDSHLWHEFRRKARIKRRVAKKRPKKKRKTKGKMQRMERMQKKRPKRRKRRVEHDTRNCKMPPRATLEEAVVWSGLDIFARVRV